jgi:hypothetical protein
MATSLPPSSNDNPSSPTQYRKPKADLYTLMLVIALVAILVGILFLCLYNGVYEWKVSYAMPKAASMQVCKILPAFSGFLT